jgi:hypothetical protein
MSTGSNFLTKRHPIDVAGKEVLYAHVDGWKKLTHVITGLPPKDKKAYHLSTRGSHTFIVNGFVAGGTIDDRNFDYNNIKWNGLK